MKPKIMLRKKWANKTRRSPWIQFPPQLACWWTGFLQHLGCWRPWEAEGSSVCQRGVTASKLRPGDNPAMLKPQGCVWWWGLGLGTIGPQQWDLVYGLAPCWVESLMRTETVKGWFPVLFSTLNLGWGQVALTNTLLIKWMNTCIEINRWLPACFLPTLFKFLASTRLQRPHKGLF